MKRYYHLYLRGNYHQDIIFDWVDYVNFWNRVWLAAKAKDVKILAIELMPNHFHIVIMIRTREGKEQAHVSSFMHFLRMSLTHYFNRRYGISGMLGSRRFGRAEITDPQSDGGDDLRDAIRYTSRNVLHHKISRDFWRWPWSTIRHPFRIVPSRCDFTSDNAPQNLLHQYLPYPNELPDGWAMTAKGVVIPPSSVYDLDGVEQLFRAKSNYVEMMNQKTRREEQGEAQESKLGLPTKGKQNRGPLAQDTEIAQWIEAELGLPIVKATNKQKRDILKKLLQSYPGISRRQLSRILAIPAATISYYLKKLNTC